MTQQHLSSYEVLVKLVHKRPNACQDEFLTLSVKQQLFPWFQKKKKGKSLITIDIRMFTIPNFFSWSFEKFAKKGIQLALLYIDLVTLSWVQSLIKWYKMVEVKGAYRHVRYEKNWLKNLRTIPNIIRFCHTKQPSREPDTWTHLITQIHIVLLIKKNNVHILLCLSVLHAMKNEPAHVPVWVGNM